MQARKKTVHPRHFNIHLLMQQGAPPSMVYQHQRATKAAGTSVMSNNHTANEKPSKVVTKNGSGLRV